MRKTFKRSMAILLAVILAFSVMTVGVVGASAEDGKLEVTVSSTVPELFPTSTQYVDSSSDTLTVTYWFNFQDYMMVNNQWKLTYDPSILRYNTDEGVNQTVSNNKTTYLVYKFPDNELGSMEFNPECDQAGVMKGNITKAEGFDCYDEGKLPFLSITFDIIAANANSTEVCLDLEVLQVRHKNADDTSQPVDFINHSAIMNNDVPFTADESYTAAYEGEYNPNYGAEPIHVANLVPNSYTIVLMSSITMNFYVTPDDVADYDEYWVEVTREGKTDKLSLAGVDPTYHDYIFQYPDILPQQFTDDITAVIHGVKDGQEYYGDEYTRSVSFYINNQITKAKANPTEKNLKWLTVMTDLAVYGGEAQKITGKTEHLVTAGLEDDIELYSSKTLETEDIRDYHYATITNPTIDWKAPTVKMGGAIEIRAYFKPNDGETLDGKYVEVKVLDRTVRYTASDFVYDTNYGEYYFDCDALYAHQLDTPVYFTMYNADGSACTDTMQYSVGSYVNRQMNNNPNGQYTPLITAMMKYGLASKAYGGF